MRKKKKNEEQTEQEKAESKKKKRALRRWRFRRSVVAVGWLVLIGSVVFGVYKNFTAIDRHTVHEKKVITEKVQNISGVETFVKDFAKVYFAYAPNSEAIMQKAEALGQYMQADLAERSQYETDRQKEPVTVEEVKVYDVSAVGKDNKNFRVLFTVQQTVKQKSSQGAYVVQVHSDKNAYVITKCPTMTSMPQKSVYEEKYLTTDNIVAADVTEDVTKFLETFWKVYPKASETELAYYCKDPAVHPIEKDYNYVAMEDLVIKEEKGGYKVACFVQYQSKETGVYLNNQYELQLEQQESGEYIIKKMR